MGFAFLIVAAMALFAATAASAFGWAVATGQFRHSAQAAASIFWDEPGALEGEARDGE